MMAAYFLIINSQQSATSNINTHQYSSNMNYHNRKFRPVSSSNNSETDSSTLFHYQQIGNIVTAQYSSQTVAFGHLIGLVNEKGIIDMRYHQVNTGGELMTGTCISTPELLPNGKIRLHEKWLWTSGDRSAGESVLEEV
jgi:hypothetical protein